MTAAISDGRVEVGWGWPENTGYVDTAISGPPTEWTHTRPSTA